MLTVIDQLENPLYIKEDFVSIFAADEIVILRVPENIDFDGSIISKVPRETTHLLMRIIDKLDATELDHLNNLKYVGICSTGWWDEYFNESLLKERGVTVTNNPTYAINAVAEAVFATLLSLKRHLLLLPMGSITTEVPVGQDIASKTLGIIGLGRIGEKVAAIGNGFGMNVISSSQKSVGGVSNVSRRQLLNDSNVISIHVPMSAGTVLAQEDFAQLSSSATVINSAGFELLDAEGLYEFLRFNEQAHYIDLSYPEGELFEKVKTLPNAHFYPLFSNQTSEAFVGKKQTPISTLQDFVRNGNCQNTVIEPNTLLASK